MATVIERVRAGATFLDSQVVGWAEKIDPDSLDIESCTTCMLGQLFGHFGRGYGKLEIDFDTICSFGFDAESAPDFEEANRLTPEEADVSDARVESELLALKAAWLTEIALRLATPEAEEARVEASPADVGEVWGAL